MDRLVCSNGHAQVSSFAVSCFQLQSAGRGEIAISGVLWRTYSRTESPRHFDRPPSMMRVNELNKTSRVTGIARVAREGKQERVAFYFSCLWCMDDRAFDGLDFLPSVGIIFLRGKRKCHIGTGLEATRPSRPGN